MADFSEEPARFLEPCHRWAVLDESRRETSGGRGKCLPRDHHYPLAPAARPIRAGGCSGCPTSGEALWRNLQAANDPAGVCPAGPVQAVVDPQPLAGERKGNSGVKRGGVSLGRTGIRHAKGAWGRALTPPSDAALLAVPDGREVALRADASDARYGRWLGNRPRLTANLPRRGDEQDTGRPHPPIRSPPCRPGFSQSPAAGRRSRSDVGRGRAGPAMLPGAMPAAGSAAPGRRTGQPRPTPFGIVGRSWLVITPNCRVGRPGAIATVPPQCATGRRIAGR